jgi:hypothetical protein
MKEDLDPFKRKIGDYDAEFRLSDGTLGIILKSVRHSAILFANYSRDTIPPKLSHVLESPEELFNVLRKVEEKDLKVSGNDELVLTMDMVVLKRDFLIPLERADLSSEEKMAH